MKTIKYTFIAVVFTVVLASVMYYGEDIKQKFTRVEYVRNTASTSTPVQVEVSNDVEKARKQIEEATNKLNAEENKILAETEAASTTAHTEIAKIMAEFESIKSENDKKLEEINKVRSSF